MKIYKHSEDTIEQYFGDLNFDIGEPLRFLRLGYVALSKEIVLVVKDSTLAIMRREITQIYQLRFKQRRNEEEKPIFIK